MNLFLMNKAHIETQQQIFGFFLDDLLGAWENIAYNYFSAAEGNFGLI